jgi:hypothetical protein
MQGAGKLHMSREVAPKWCASWCRTAGATDSRTLVAGHLNALNDSHMPGYITFCKYCTTGHHDPGCIQLCCTYPEPLQEPSKHSANSAPHTTYSS